MKINYKKYISLFVIGYLSIIFLGLYLIQPFVFSTNDDKLMQDILSGSISGTPDSHAIFLNYTFSLLISYGYKMIPYINWYGVILVALIFVASVWILEILVRSFASVKEVIVCILLFTGLFIYFFYSEIVGLQHMSTAGYLLSAALFLFAHDTQPIDFEKQRFLSRYGRIIFLVLFAYFLRADAVIMFIPFYVIAFAYKIYTNKEQLRDYVKLVCVLGLSIFLFGTLHFFAYSNVEWKSYKEFNQYRSKIYDTYGLPDYDLNEDFYAEIGLSKEEFSGMNQNYLLFSINLDEKNMKEVYEFAKRQYLINNPIESRLEDSVANYRNYIVNNKYVIFYLLLLIALLNLLFSIVYKDKALFWGTIGIFLTGKVTVLYLFFIGRVANRSYIPITIAECLLLFACLLNVKKEAVNKRAKTVWNSMYLGIILFFLLFHRSKIIADLKYYVNFYGSYAEFSEKYISFDNEMNHKNSKLYIVDLRSISYFTEYALSYDGYPYQNYIMSGGWLSYSPFYQDKVKEVGLRLSDITFEDLAEEQVFFVFQDHVDIQVDYLKSIIEKEDTLDLVLSDTLELPQNIRFQFFQIQNSN